MTSANEPVCLSRSLACSCARSCSLLSLPLSFLSRSLALSLPSHASTTETRSCRSSHLFQRPLWSSTPPSSHRGDCTSDSEARGLCTVIRTVLYCPVAISISSSNEMAKIRAITGIRKKIISCCTPPSLRAAGLHRVIPLHGVTSLQSNDDGDVARCCRPSCHQGPPASLSRMP
jgi:hypothetical protein